MAKEEEEDVIIVEDDDNSKQEEKDSDSNNDNEKKSEDELKKKKSVLIIVALLIFVIILLLLLLLVVVKKKKDNKPISQNQQIEQLTKKLTKKHINKDTIQKLVKKANILYKNGNKEKALKLLDKLSMYSESLSSYNLGVIKLKENNCSKAIEYFNNAIKESDNRLVSSINATYCALKLKDKKLFNYYSKTSELYLSDEVKSKNYPYYYSLVHYYLGEEFETLLPLKENIAIFHTEMNKLKEMIYNLYDDPYQVLNYSKDPFVLGVSYARIGEYSLARGKLLKAVDFKPLKAGYILSLVDLKLGLYREASKYLTIAKKREIVLYPIKVGLKKSLFDVIPAQKEFQSNFLVKKEDFYDLFFYYAPYKVFNAQQTINYIRKGSSGIAIDNIEQTNHYLHKSSTISRLNLKISKGIREALTYHIRKANKRFQKLVDTNRNHEILHYDLALTYAQLKNYPKAYIHFLRAYHLNPNNYLAGIFAVLNGNLSGFDTKRLVADLNENIDSEDPENQFYLAFLGFINNNMPLALSWLQGEHKNSELYLIFDIAVAKTVDRIELFKSKSHTLNSIMKNDVISNLLDFYAENYEKNIKQFSLKYHEFFKSKKFNLDGFFYGPVIVQEYYLNFSRITGMLSTVRKQLLKKAESNKYDVVPILQSLAFVNLFTGHYEESYTIFNDLIDNKKVDDSKTLFYGAVASIRAGHNANAIALLELSKGKNKNAYEARYGLGLLYQEIGNLKGATIQYEKIPDNFENKFFDFKLK